jgi:GT2 family glycosyltransferase/glycosyltransferase involved in cell wall biosynthesis
LPDWVDVAVIDNASSDNSAELARRAGVRVVANDVNAGFAAACNQGALLGAADFILFLNPDAAIDGENLENLFRRMEEDPGIGVASPIIRHPDGSQQRERWPFPSASGAWRETLGLHRLGLRSGDDQGFVIGACFLVRRSVFTEAGGFDTRYWLYGEEIDLCRRIRDRGWKIETVDDATAVHVGGASSEPTDPFVLEHFCRGSERFVADYAGSLALLSFRLADLLGSAVVSTVPGPRQRRQLHQARLRRVLRQLAKEPFSVGMNSPANAALGHSIVVCSLEAWDDVWRRNQFLVRELLDADPHLRVLFVEPAFDRLHRLTSGGGPHRKRGLRSALPDGRLIVFEPVKTLPRVLGGFADWSLCRQVRLTVSRLGFDDPTLWVNDASYARLTEETGWSTLYDITDDWLPSWQTEPARRRLKENEARLFNCAGAVVVCSADLVAGRRKQRPDLELVPNAVDVEHFSRPQDRPTDLPKAPIAVYVGTLDEDRLDIDLIADLAGASPNLEIVLVGPNSLTSASVEALGAHRNVTLLGPRPYAVVPAYLQHADVVIVPHIVSPLTESLDPIMAYECLAVGRPTIATPAAGFRALSSPVVVVEREGFVVEVAEALARDDNVMNSEVPSWTERAVAFAGALRRARDPKSRRTSVVSVDHPGCKALTPP